MIDNAFRAWLPHFVRPLLSLYARLGWSPNQISALGFGVALAACAAVTLHFWWLAVALWWLSRLADGTDGLHARATGQETDFGAYLDIVLDMAAYGAMVLAFSFAIPELQLQWMAMLFLYVLCIASALSLGMQEAKRALPPRDDRGLRLGAGLAEGGETGIAYSCFLLFPEYLEILTTLWVVILATTVIARSLLAYRILKDAVGEVDDLSSQPDSDAGETTTPPVGLGTTQIRESPKV
ncbi:MAG: CDP-alcohol phosphatidyltransferase family protein [Myxococcales bacterium]|nr:CDP-alcohol phosphatidyltransferase family protein [Myxococcales bacterium]HIK83948.1 CDP-alcohol phosphatidyltransferase family protein [Myxococcales bacterium]